MSIDGHKHCVFCGEVVDNMTLSTQCFAATNTTPTDTSGKKYHVVLSLLVRKDENLGGETGEKQRVPVSE